MPIAWELPQTNKMIEKKLHWLGKKVRKWYQRIPFKYHPSELWYSFTCWAWHRYSTITPRYCSQTFHDRCDLLPHVMFEILSQFVENELNPDYRRMPPDPASETYLMEKRWYDAEQEMLALYHWWHKFATQEEPERPKGKPRQEWHDEQVRKELADAEELKNNLHRLVDVAPCMWT
jgi:hypothetical protein